MSKSAGIRDVKRVYGVDHKAYLQVKHYLDPSHLAVYTDEIYISSGIPEADWGQKVVMLR